MRFILVIIWLVSGSFNFQAEGETMFGVCVSYQASGEMTRYIMYKQNGSTISLRRTVVDADLIKYASGYWPSAYNPKRENLFEKNGIQCKVIFDSTLYKDYPLCSPMDSLWKIRFREHPFNQRAGNGWSNDSYRPSPAQEQYLFTEFQIRNIDRDFFAGENFWKIMRFVMDETWIEKYKNIP